MKIFIIIILLFVSKFCLAQHIEYKYDLAGNRIERKFFVVRMANPSPEKDSSIVIENKFGIRVYPNPTTEYVNVSIASLSEGENAIVQLSNQQGMIFFEKIQKSPMITFSITELKAGTYFIRVLINDESVSYKILKL